MPTYEYECTKCSRMFELFQPITARAKRYMKTECEQCDNKAPVRRCIGAGSGVIFKGSGFYTTDYRSDSYNKAAKADKEAAEGKSSDKKTKDGKKTSADSSKSDAKKSSSEGSKKGKSKE